VTKYTNDRYMIWVKFVVLLKLDVDVLQTHLSLSSCINQLNLGYCLVSSSYIFQRKKGFIITSGQCQLNTIRVAGAQNKLNFAGLNYGSLLGWPVLNWLILSDVFKNHLDYQYKQFRHL